MKKTRRIIILFTVAFSLSAATDPFVGVWKLVPSKSTFETGAPSFLLATIQVESSGGGLKSTSSGADGEGIVSDLTFNCQLNETPCKVTPATSPMRSDSAVDTIKMKRVDPHTIVATGTKDGKPVYSDRRVVSANGKTMMVLRDGTTPAGKKYASKIVLERIR